MCPQRGRGERLGCGINLLAHPGCPTQTHQLGALCRSHRQIDTPHRRIVEGLAPTAGFAFSFVQCSHGRSPPKSQPARVAPAACYGLPTRGNGRIIQSLFKKRITTVPQAKIDGSLCAMHGASKAGDPQAQMFAVHGRHRTGVWDNYGDPRPTSPTPLQCAVIPYALLHTVLGATM